MACLSPRTVGFLDDGKTIAWSQKHYSKQYPTFQLPCGQCLQCRLDYSISWAIRCTHEAQMHPENSFITLTYSDANLNSKKLNYLDFQLFIKRLRSHIFRNFIKNYGPSNWALLSKQERKQVFDPHKISIFVTGEYGDKTKRPHWHALIFNYSPTDLKYHHSNHNKDKIYTSQTLTDLWGLGHVELGSVTFQSAAYCARYAAKKLVHGKDQDHDYHPISKKSSHQAIGKKWLEKYYTDIFNHGYLVAPNGTKVPIPRYYEKWLQKNHPDKWEKYLTIIKEERRQKAEAIALKEKQETDKINAQRLNQNFRKGFQVDKQSVKTAILNDKFKRLQKHLKGDI